MNNAKYYTKRDGTLYTDYAKEEIKQLVNPQDPATFIPFLQALDLPYIKREWECCVDHAKRYNRPLTSVFTRYVMYMQLCGFRHLTFKDSTTCNEEHKFAVYRGHKRESEELLCMFKDYQAATVVDQATQEQDLERFIEVLQLLVGEDPNKWN